MGLLGGVRMVSFSPIPCSCRTLTRQRRLRFTSRISRVFVFGRFVLDVVWLWESHVPEHFSRVIAFGRSVSYVTSLWTSRFSRIIFPGRCVWSFGFSLWGLASRSPCSPLVAVDVYRCVRTVL